MLFNRGASSHGSFRAVELVTDLQTPELNACDDCLSVGVRQCPGTMVEPMSQNFWMSEGSTCSGSSGWTVCQSELACSLRSPAEQPVRCLHRRLKGVSVDDALNFFPSTHQSLREDPELRLHLLVHSLMFSCYCSSY